MAFFCAAPVTGCTHLTLSGAYNSTPGSASFWLFVSKPSNVPTRVQSTHQRIHIIHHPNLNNLRIAKGGPITEQRATAVGTEMRCNRVPAVGSLGDRLRLAGGHGEAVAGYDDVRRVGGAGNLSAIGAVTQSFRLNVASVPDASVPTKATSVRHLGQTIDYADSGFLASDWSMDRCWSSALQRGTLMAAAKNIYIPSLRLRRSLESLSSSPNPAWDDNVRVEALPTVDVGHYAISPRRRTRPRRWRYVLDK